MKDANKEPSFFFNGKSIGRSLREIAVDLIKTESDDVISRWFHSESNTDLFTWVDHGHNIIKQQLSFHGHIVEWNCLEGIKTGFVVETDLGNAVEKKLSSETIQFDLKPMPKAIDLALEILINMEVDDSFRRQLVGNFKDPQYIQTMTPQAFLERFWSKGTRLLLMLSQPNKPKQRQK